MNLNTVKHTSFILKDGKYREIATSKLIRNGRWLPPYDKRRFLKLHGYLMEVNQKTYIEFRHQQRRDKYLREEAELHNQFSYNAADTDEYSGEELIVDILTNVENTALREIMIESVRMMVASLSSSDHDLIHALFYEDMTEREYAEKMGIPSMTVHDRKIRILRQMKKSLGK